MEHFDVECPKCRTHVALSVPDEVEVHPFPCPGCGFRLDPESGPPTGPMPQHRDGGTPAPQARVYKFGRRR